MKFLLMNLIFICFSCVYHCSNSEAIEITNNKLDYLKSYLDGRTEDLITERVSIISFFELLTGIESESDANFFGKFWPTMNDYNRWKEWLDKNKDYLTLDSNKQVIYVNPEKE